MYPDDFVRSRGSAPEVRHAGHAERIVLHRFVQQTGQHILLKNICNPKASWIVRCHDGVRTLTRIPPHCGRSIGEGVKGGGPSCLTDEQSTLRARSSDVSIRKR